MDGHRGRRDAVGGVAHAKAGDDRTLRQPRPEDEGQVGSTRRWGGRGGPGRGEGRGGGTGGSRGGCGREGGRGRWGRGPGGGEGGCGRGGGGWRRVGCGGDRPHPLSIEVSPAGFNVALIPPDRQVLVGPAAVGKGGLLLLVGLCGDHHLSPQQSAVVGKASSVEVKLTGEEVPAVAPDHQDLVDGAVVGQGGRSGAGGLSGDGEVPSFQPASARDPLSVNVQAPGAVKISPILPDHQILVGRGEVDDVGALLRPRRRGDGDSVPRQPSRVRHPLPVDVVAPPDHQVFVGQRVIGDGGPPLVPHHGGDGEISPHRLPRARHAAAVDVHAARGAVPAILPDHQVFVVHAVVGDLGVSLRAGRDGIVDGEGAAQQLPLGRHALAVDVGIGRRGESPVRPDHQVLVGGAVVGDVRSLLGVGCRGDGEGLPDERPRAGDPLSVDVLAASTVGIVPIVHPGHQDLVGPGVVGDGRSALVPDLGGDGEVVADEGAGPGQCSRRGRCRHRLGQDGEQDQEQGQAGCDAGFCHEAPPRGHWGPTGGRPGCTRPCTSPPCSARCRSRAGATARRWGRSSHRPRGDDQSR